VLREVADQVIHAVHAFAAETATTGSAHSTKTERCAKRLAVASEDSGGVPFEEG
jgi:hypothetical protein